MVDLRGEGIEDDTDFRHEIVDEGEGNADVGVGVDEVRRAVYRITDEGRGGGEVHSGFVTFLTKESGKVELGGTSQDWTTDKGWWSMGRFTYS